MKIGAFAILLDDRPFEEALDQLKRVGLDAVETRISRYVSDHYCRPAELLQDAERLAAFALERRGMSMLTFIFSRTWPFGRDSTPSSAL